MGEVWFMSGARPRLPVITVYLVRARARRPPPAAASRSVPLQMASGAPGRTPYPLRSPSTAREWPVHYTYTAVTPHLHSAAARSSCLPCAGPERDTTCRASSQPASDASPSVLNSCPVNICHTKQQHITRENTITYRLFTLLYSAYTTNILYYFIH